MAIITKFDKRMLELARLAAEQSDFKTFHMGCVIVYKHHVISTASNSNKTHPLQAKYNYYRHFKKTNDDIKHSVHAEIAAIANIPYMVGKDIEWSKVKVYIYRICPGKKNHFGLAAPCDACRKALRNLGIKHLYYTGEDSYIYEELI